MFAIETPEHRLGRLVELGTVKIGTGGASFWCALCKEWQPTIDFVPHHGWFEFVADFMAEHHAECWEARDVAS